MMVMPLTRWAACRPDSNLASSTIKRISPGEELFTAIANITNTGNAIVVAIAATVMSNTRFMRPFWSRFLPLLLRRHDSGGSRAIPFAGGVIVRPDL